MTISITLLAMEGTGSLQLIIPLMLAVFTAKIAGDALTLPIYDIQIKIRGAPVLVTALRLNGACKHEHATSCCFGAEPGFWQRSCIA